MKYSTKTLIFIIFFLLIIIYSSNKEIINDFQKKPGLVHISKKRGIDVSQVYDIIKTHDMNVLNANIIKLMELK